jgi:hypothetical protein
MLMIPHCHDNQLTDGGNVVIPKHHTRSSPQKYYFSVPATHFSYKMSKPQGLVRRKGLGKLKKIHLIGSRTRDLSACSIVPYTTLPLPQKNTMTVDNTLIVILMKSVGKR